MTPGVYCGRFAPSPTGPLHLGSITTALASWLDARAHEGRWLVRIEDIDTPRCLPGADQHILQTLQIFGLQWDAPPVWQSQRTARYEAALAQLLADGAVYPCACSRKRISETLSLQTERMPKRHQTLLYPGTCRPSHFPDGKLPANQQALAWRVQVPEPEAADINFKDRWCDHCHQNLAETVGDFVLKRADGLWAYQIAVVVDDAEQGITHIVRGDDLLDSTARQIWLQRLLGYPQPRYLHLPVIVNAQGEKLSKQTGAEAVDPSDPAAVLQRAAQHLGLSMEIRPDMAVGEILAQAVPAWKLRLKQQAARLASSSLGKQPLNSI